MDQLEVDDSYDFLQEGQMWDVYSHSINVSNHGNYDWVDNLCYSLKHMDHHREWNVSLGNHSICVHKKCANSFDLPLAQF